MSDDLKIIFNKNMSKDATEIDFLLISAAEKGDLAKVKALIKKGANIFVNDEWALFEATNNGHLDVVKLLMAKGSLGMGHYYDPEEFAREGHFTEVAEYIHKVRSDLGWHKIPYNDWIYTGRKAAANTSFKKSGPKP